MKVAAFVSGAGTNLQSLINAQQRGELSPASLDLVISNRPSATALERAKQAEIPSELVDHQRYDSRQNFEAALLTLLDQYQIEAIVLAGFMRVLSPYFLERCPGQIINTHPALCPAFPGIHAVQQALDAGVKLTGCTVHFVDTGVDTGPIIFQEGVAVLPSDTVHTLHKRIQELEHVLLPKAIQQLAAGQLVCHGRHVTPN